MEYSVYNYSNNNNILYNNNNNFNNNNNIIVTLQNPKSYYENTSNSDVYLYNNNINNNLNYNQTILQQTSNDVNTNSQNEFPFLIFDLTSSTSSVSSSPSYYSENYNSNGSNCIINNNNINSNNNDSIRNNNNNEYCLSSDLSPRSPPNYNDNVQVQQVAAASGETSTSNLNDNQSYSKVKTTLIKVVKRNLFETKFCYPYSKVEDKAASLVGDLQVASNYQKFTRLITDVKNEFDNFIKRFNDSILYKFDSLTKDTQHQIILNASTFLYNPSSIESVRLSNEFETFLIDIVNRPLHRINQDVREYILNRVLKDGTSFNRKKLIHGKRKSCDFYYY